jgi:hypothetical protein
MLYFRQGTEEQFPLKSGTGAKRREKAIVHSNLCPGSHSVRLVDGARLPIPPRGDSNQTRGAARAARRSFAKYRVAALADPQVKTPIAAIICASL